MRQVILTLLFSLVGICLSLQVDPARADGAILPDNLSPGYLAVRYHHVTVNINDGHAVTQVEQEFYNPHPVTVTGRYTFPIPPEAMLSNFKAKIDGQPQPVSRQSQTQTNTALYDTLVRRRDPSLLQYADWETLVFDISLPPGGTRHMTLRYEEVLLPTGGLYHYHYVLSTERYTTQPLDEISLTIDIDSTGGLGSLYSSSHTVTTTRLGAGRARVSWQAENVQPADDFDLFFAPIEGGFSSGLLTGRREERDHFMFLFAPEIAATENDRLPKDVVFVIDRSGSMAGEKLEQARNALHYILNQLDPNDRFSIIGFDERLAILSGTLKPVNRQSLATARHFVDGLTADGGTNLEAAIQSGLGVFQQSEPRFTAVKMVLFLTDGLPTAGLTDSGLIADAVGRTNQSLAVRLHTFGVGYDVNTHLLDRLAEENGGSVTYVQPGENLERVLANFYGRIASPVLTDVAISFEGMEVADLHPQRIPDIFRDSSLLLTGRYQATDPTVFVHVQAKSGGTELHYTYQFELDQIGDSDFVPRVWATRQIGRLMDEIRLNGESTSLIKDIQALGLGYGLVTPYTTFAIQAQTEGAASTQNMSLYSNLLDLNRAEGKTTIQARVQNQQYQAAEQANLAMGANIVNNRQRSLARVANQHIDLSLLKGQVSSGPSITSQWIADNINIDRHIVFGSNAYFDLASDPKARAYLQSGSNVVFAYKGEVIAVHDPENPPQADGQNQSENYDPGNTGVVSGIFGFLKGLFGRGMPAR